MNAYRQLSLVICAIAVFMGSSVRAEEQCANCTRAEKVATVSDSVSSEFFEAVRNHAAGEEGDGPATPLPRLPDVINQVAREAGIAPLSRAEIDRLCAALLVDALAPGSAFEGGLPRGEVLAQLASAGYDGASLAMSLDRLKSAGDDPEAVFRQLSRTPPEDLRTILSNAQQNFTKALLEDEKLGVPTADLVVSALASRPDDLLRFQFWNLQHFPVADPDIAAKLLDALSALQVDSLPTSWLCPLQEMLAELASGEDSRLSAVLAVRVEAVKALAAVPRSKAKETCSTDDRGGEIVLGEFAQANLQRLTALAFATAAPRDLPPLTVKGTCSLKNFRDLARDLSNRYSRSDMFFSTSGAENCPMSIWVTEDPRSPTRRAAKARLKKEAKPEPAQVTVKIWIGETYGPPTRVINSNIEKIKRDLDGLQQFTFQNAAGAPGTR
jgi:hypothetical protein